jgi:hypothetical protein
MFEEQGFPIMASASVTVRSAPHTRNQKTVASCPAARGRRPVVPFVQAALAPRGHGEITAWAAIIAVPTMVCGVYGMNFDHMPELRWRFGYPLVLAVIATATACLLIHRGFKRNGWL